MLNFIALYLISFLVRGPLQEPTHVYPQTETLSSYARLPVILPATRLHAGFALAVVISAAAWWWLHHTAAGFRARAVGKNRDAARVAGKIDIEKTTRNVFLLSGALAGLAGAVEVQGVTFALYENLSPGYGYTAIAVALLARLNPLGVIASGLFFGFLEAGANALQRDVGIPATAVSVIEALIILSALAAEKVRGTRTMQIATANSDSIVYPV
jgi:simple sugar transport system permease protein